MIVNPEVNTTPHMAQSSVERIGHVLARLGTPGAFASSRAVKAEDLRLDVYGVGRLQFPLTEATARRLCEIARPAQHGYKDQTRLDRRVRDCWEIPAELITIDQPRWNRTLIPQLDRLRRDLGLPHACRLRAELHNLLIYGPGQFFVPHQDSEKSDEMIGTLVVGLPSRFTGGTFVVEHHDETLSFGGSAERLSLIAFYADCHHEVKPVESGYRVVLTCNLSAEGAVPASTGPAAATTALTDALRRFFETPVPPHWSGDREQGPPDRLVYLLDHQYTQRGLAWTRLKNADAVRAAALQDAARKLDCECFLALADVHETWSCEDDYSASGHRRRGDRWDEDDDNEDEDADASGGDPELTDLIDSAVELRHWVGLGERPQEIASLVAHGELCCTRPSVEFEPFESEHEGYMGNEGNTVDRWYHRAAVVLWPRERSFVIRAKASASWAMGEIAKTLRKDGAAQAQALAQRVLPFWAEAVRRDSAKALFSATLKTAAALDDAALAAALLKPFPLTGPGPKTVAPLTTLLTRYGQAWCAALFDQWSPEYKPHEMTDARLSWIAAALPGLCRGLCADAVAGTVLAQRVLGQQWTWTAACMNDVRKHARPRDLAGFLPPLCTPLLALIESSRITDQPELHARLIDAATDNDLSLVLLKQAHGYPPEVRRDLGLGSLHARGTQAFTQRLETPVRANGDWSIATPLSCPRELGPTLMPFLRDATRTRLEWPLAEAGRAQVHRLIDDHDLPVHHTTRRSGRPYTLVLEKTRALFEREAAHRRSWQAGRQWLAQTAADF